MLRLRICWVVLLACYPDFSLNPAGILAPLVKDA